MSERNRVRGARKLRVAAAVPLTDCPHLVADTLLSIAGTPSIDLVAVLEIDGAVDRRRSIGRGLFNFYVAADRMISGGVRRSHLSVREAVRAGLASMPDDSVSPSWNTVSPGEPVDATSNSARLEGADVVLWLADGDPGAYSSGEGEGEVLTIPAYSRAAEEGGRALTADCALAGTVARVALYAEDGPAARAPVDESVMAIRSMSWHRTREAIMQRAALLVQRRLQLRMARGSAASSLPAKVIDGPRVAVPAWLEELGRERQFMALGRFNGRKALAVGLRHAQRVTEWRQRWFVAVTEAWQPGRPLVAKGRFRVLLPPQGSEYADPFTFDWRGKSGILLEELVRGTEKAHITLIELDEGESAGRARVVLDLPTHLSYPYTFENEGQLYMLPESQASGNVDLYRATDSDQLEWLHVATLLKGVRAVDSSLVVHNGRFWLFCNLPAPDSDSDWEELHLYSSASLTEGWEGHPLNPVVSDVSRTRPAGAPFMCQDQTIRPAQDCSERYGGAVVLNRIDVLDTERYLETPLARLSPDWEPRLSAFHTYNTAGPWPVVDGRWRWTRKARSAAIPIRSAIGGGQGGSP
jgi:hypothetical protein